MIDLAELTITAAAAQLRAGSITASELVDAVLARAEATEPLVHAYSELLADEARTEAFSADARAARGDELPPLHGIPIAVKDMIAVRGVAMRAGSRVLDVAPAGRDAECVRRLRAEGAIIIGTTVPHEFGFGSNRPPTRNAWDYTRAPGGSSAGSAVAVAAGSALGALGTDTGGSVRVPAALNGVVGLKPRFGAISTEGVFPMSPALDTVGLITRSVEDAALLHDVLVDEPDRVGDGWGSSGARIGVLGSAEQQGLAPELAAILERVVAELRHQADAEADTRTAGLTAGVRVRSIRWPGRDRIPAAGMATVFADAADQHRDLLATRADRYDPGTLLNLATGIAMPASARSFAARQIGVIRADTEDLFGRNDVDLLASLTFPGAAGPADDILDGGGLEAMRAAVAIQMLANLSGLPAITVPCALTAGGLPVGLQLIGRPGAERRLFSVALLVHRIAGLPQRPVPVHSRDRPPAAFDTPAPTTAPDRLPGGRS